MSSPYNPRANGLAESAVKTVKNMLKKCLEQGKDVERALYEWRNLPREHGSSPSQLLFGRRQRMLLPQPDSAYAQVSFEKAALAKDKHFDAQGVRYDKDKVDLPVLSIGQCVRVQVEKSSQWQALATVVDARPDGLSYIVDIGGREQLRSRHMLRPEPVPQVESERDGPNSESERDGPKVGVSPLPKARPSERSLTNSGNSRNSTGRKCPSRVGSPSLSRQTRQSTSIQTVSASSTSSGPLSCQGPLSSLPWKSLGAWSPCVATSGPGMTGGSVNATISSLR